MDPLIENYLRRVADVFMSAGVESLEELTIADVENDQGLLDTTMRFPGGCRLSVNTRAGVQDDRPDLRSYSIHFMDGDDNTIFRYDNSRHFPGAGDSPHHKHEGERVFICPQPTIRQIRNEIADYLIRGQPNG